LSCWGKGGEKRRGVPWGLVLEFLGTVTGKRRRKADGPSRECLALLIAVETVVRSSCESEFAGVGRIPFSEKRRSTGGEGGTIALVLWIGKSCSNRISAGQKEKEGRSGGSITTPGKEWCLTTPEVGDRRRTSGEGQGAPRRISIKIFMRSLAGSRTTGLYAVGRLARWESREKKSGVESRNPFGRNSLNVHM